MAAQKATCYLMRKPFYIEEKVLVETPLSAAVKKGHCEVVTFLLTREAQLLANDDDKETPDV